MMNSRNAHVICGGLTFEEVPVELREKEHSDAAQGTHARGGLITGAEMQMWIKENAAEMAAGDFTRVEADARAQVNFGLMLMKRLSFMATTLRGRTIVEKTAIRDALAREVWPLIAAGRVKPVIDKVFPLAEAQAAHARMVQSSHIGKILLAL